jgi:hypothetical protein
MFPSMPALSHRIPKYLEHSIVLSKFSPRTEIAERVPIELRKSFAPTAGAPGALKAQLSSASSSTLSAPPATVSGRRFESEESVILIGSSIEKHLKLVSRKLFETGRMVGA